MPNPASTPSPSARPSPQVQDSRASVTPAPRGVTAPAPASGFPSEPRAPSEGEDRGSPAAAEDQAGLFPAADSTALSAARSAIGSRTANTVGSRARHTQRRKDRGRHRWRWEPQARERGRAVLVMIQRICDLNLGAAPPAAHVAERVVCYLVEGQEKRVPFETSTRPLVDHGSNSYRH
jgi:hypothetical protein